MNYLAEIVAFTEWKQVNTLPGNAIALWHELMAAWNKVAWAANFTVANGRLQADAGLSRKEFEHARQLLINLGRIHYKKSDRVNEAGRYTMIPIVQKGQQKVQQEVIQEEHTRGNERGTLNKPKRKPKIINNLISEFAAGNEELDQAINDFVEMRKSIKKPITDRAIQMIFDKLNEFTNDDAEKIAVLNQSTMNSWQSVYELKNKGGADSAKSIPKAATKPRNQAADYSEYD